MLNYDTKSHFTFKPLYLFYFSHNICQYAINQTDIKRIQFLTFFAEKTFYYAHFTGQDGYNRKVIIIITLIIQTRIIFIINLIISCKNCELNNIPVMITSIQKAMYSSKINDGIMKETTMKPITTKCTISHNLIE